MGIQVKLRAGIPAERREAALRTVTEASGVEPSPLFPGAQDDPELSSLFRLEAVDELQLVERLNGLPDVEFAESDVPRRLIR
jgi:hypothetical protein